MICPHNTTLGKQGEDLACAELSRRGYAILARRYRTRAGEIDIVAREGRTVVFVEVKTRTSVRFGLPAEAITWRKRRRLQIMALAYLSRRRLYDVPFRFDIVSVMVGEGQVRIEVIRSALE